MLSMQRVTFLTVNVIAAGAECGFAVAVFSVLAAPHVHAN